MFYKSFFRKQKIDIDKFHPFIRLVATHNIEAYEHTCPRRKLYDYQLLFVVGGNIHFVFQDEIINLETGDAIIIPPNILYREIIQPNEYCNYYICHFDAFYLPEKKNFSVDDMYIKYCLLHYVDAPFLNKFLIKNDPNFGIFDGPIIYKGNKLADFIEDLMKFNELFISYSLSKRETIKVYLNSLLMKILFDLEENDKDKTFNVFDKFVDFIEGNYNSNIDVSKFAIENGYSPNYFCKKFTDYVGCSPSTYINKKRMELAVELLSKGLRVIEVADQSGFKDPYYFSKAFKKYYGMTPKEFKKRGN